MNKKQSVVMWICVIWIVLVWLSAPRELTSYERYDPKTKTSEEKHANVLVKPGGVFVDWAMGGILASALIYTLRPKRNKQGG